MRKPVGTPVASADDPARSNSEANATVYPSTTHWAVDGAPPRSAPIARSATFTIVASSVIIRNPAEIAASASAWPFDLPRPPELGTEWAASNFMLQGCRPGALWATTGWLTLLGAS